MEVDGEEDDLMPPGALEASPPPLLTGMASDPLGGGPSNTMGVPVQFLLNVTDRGVVLLAGPGRTTETLTTPTVGVAPDVEESGLGRDSRDPSGLGLASPSTQGARSTSRRRDELLGVSPTAVDLRPVAAVVAAKTKVGR